MEVHLYHWDICYASPAWKALLLAAPADSPHSSSKQQEVRRTARFLQADGSSLLKQMTAKSRGYFKTEQMRCINLSA